MKKFKGIQKPEADKWDAFKVKKEQLNLVQGGCTCTYSVCDMDGTDDTDSGGDCCNTNGDLGGGGGGGIQPLQN
jgi:hypothetical protein